MKKKVVRYKVISSNRLDDFNNQCNDLLLLNEGYQPKGKLKITYMFNRMNDIYYTQLFIEKSLEE